MLLTTVKNHTCIVTTGASGLVLSYVSRGSKVCVCGGGGGGGGALVVLCYDWYGVGRVWGHAPQKILEF